MRLLSKAEKNNKLSKSIGRGYLVYGLSLRPHKLSGYNVCPHATAGCAAACVLEHSGRGNIPSVRDARDAKTKMLFEDRPGFLALLHKELYAAEKRASRLGLEVLVRLNVASDIVWEKLDRTIFTKHPDITYYDYTKNPNRFKNLPDNYHLTYSYNESSKPAKVQSILDAGHNVAVVFDTVYNPSHGIVGTLPKTKRINGRRYRIVDGDNHDIRLPETDGKRAIVGLRAKGGVDIVRQGLQSGFVHATINGVGKT